MKLTSSDILELRKALMAANKAGLESLVIHEGKVRGLNATQNAAIFSNINLSIDPNTQLGIVRLGELEKRLALFGDDVLIEGEVNDANKVRRLVIRGKAGRVEFRCTDPKLITYPKTNADEPRIVVKLQKPEVALLSKGVKLLGGEALAMQVKRDGGVHIECSDSNNDRFELDLATPAEFVDEPAPFVHMYDTGSKGVFLSMLDQLAKDQDTVDLVVMRSGNISMQLFGFELLAVPRIKTGE
jgi:hypothetical protein